MVREDLAESFYGRPEQDIQFFHGHTYAGNPLAAAAGIAVIEELVEKRLPEKARRLGDHLRRGLEGLKDLGSRRCGARCFCWSWPKTRAPRPLSGRAAGRCLKAPP
jgi:adenosylmethionine-8-amino-7-oxononanoate aminotransferase